MSKRKERVAPTRHVDRREKKAPNSKKEPEVYYDVRGRVARPPVSEFEFDSGTGFLPERPKA